MSFRVKVTDGGQISVPAKVRKRWGSAYLTAEDRGDHLVLRPAVDDPLEEVFAVFAAEARGVEDLGRVREVERAADGEVEAAKRADR